MGLHTRNYFKNNIGAISGRNTSGIVTAIDSGIGTITDSAPGIRILNDSVYFENLTAVGAGGANGQPGSHPGGGGPPGANGCGSSAIRFNQLHTSFGARITVSVGGAPAGATSLLGYSSGSGNAGNRGNPPQPNPSPGNPGTSNPVTFASEVVSGQFITTAFGGPQGGRPLNQAGQRSFSGYPTSSPRSTRGDASPAQPGAVFGSIPGTNRKFRP